MDGACSLIIAILLCSFVGFAWTSALGNPKAPLQNLLLAPATGIALFVVPAYSLSWLGLSVTAFGYSVVFGEIAVAIVLLWRTKPTLRRIDVLTFGILLCVTLALTATPMMSFGFGWLGYANPDISNYGLAAQRLLEGGLAKTPSMGDLLYHRDLSSELYFLDFVSHERPGAQLLLALLATCAHKVPLQMVMQLSVAAFFATVAATAGNLTEESKRWWLPLVGGVMMAASSLGAFGTFLGLLGQCLGIPLLVASIAVISSTQTVGSGSRESIWRLSLLTAILVAGLAISYPEIGIFLVVGFCFFVTAVLMRRQMRGRDLFVFVAAAAVFTGALLNVYVPTVISVALRRSAIVASPQHLFDQYLVPSGLANLWGFTPLLLTDAQPWLNIAIASGIVLLLIASLKALHSTSLGHMSGATCTAMLCVAIYAYAHNLDFPLFKIAMYIQPLLIICLCAGVMHIEKTLTDPPRLGTALAMIIPVIAALYGLHAQQFYVAASRDVPGTVSVAISAIPNGSPRQFLDAVSTIARSTPGLQVVLDDTDLTIEGYVGSFAGRRSFVSPGGSLLDPDLANPVHFHQDREVTVWIEKYARRYAKLHPKRYFPLLTARPPRATSFLLDLTLATGPGTAVASYWISSPRLTVLNRFGAPRDGTDLSLAAYNQIANHLILMNHALGVTLPWERRRVALTQPPEPDRFDPGGERVQGFGQYELFEVIHPSPHLRVIFSVSESGRRDGSGSDTQHSIPPVNAIGDHRIQMDAIGSGSARLISPEVTPRYIDGRAFIALDMGRAARQEYYPRSGLMTIFGKEVPLDNSLLVGLARDISAISPQQFRELKAPPALDSPESVLRNVDLFYSGMYEDGFINRDAWFRLRSDVHRDRFVVSGDVTELGSVGSIAIEALIDNMPVLSVREPGGPFLVSVPVHVAEGNHKVTIRANRVFERPSPDNRRVSFQLSRVGFYRDADLANSFDIYDARQPITLGRGWYPYETFQGQHFRWVSDDAQIRLEPDPRPETIDLDVEAGPGVGYRPFKLIALAGEHQLLTTTVSNGSVHVRVPAHTRRATVILHVVGGGLRSSSDSRTLNFRVLHLALGQARHDIPSPDSVDFGANWYGLEHFAGEDFRWASPDAVLLVAQPVNLRLLIEPGPAVRGDEMKLAVQAPDGTHQMLDVHGREWITLKASLAGDYHFEVNNGNRIVGADPRTLNFRVFRIESLPITRRERGDLLQKTN